MSPQPTKCAAVKASPSICWVLAMMLLISALTGCRINDINDARRLARIVSFTSKPEIRVRKRKGPFCSPIRKLIARRRQLSERTGLLLRQNNLSGTYQSSPERVIQIMQANCRRHPTMNQVHALAEISEIEADWALRSGDNDQGAKLYATAALHAYQFLFDPQLNIQRNAYDPQFREICDISSSCGDG